jgi:hypothetical protein
MTLEELGYDCTRTSLLLAHWCAFNSLQAAQDRLEIQSKQPNSTLNQSTGDETMVSSLVDDGLFHPINERYAIYMV